MLAPDWKDYKILGTGDGLKLERWGDVVLLRPDPQAIWSATVDFSRFDTHARYERDKSGGGRWIINKPMPEEWTVRWRDMKFYVRPTGFKHTGLFPEQAVNWSILTDEIKKSKDREPIRILNLFAYTGASTAALAKCGAVVTHVDAAKGMVERAQSNCALNGVPRENTRFIVDDCKKFVMREIRRGKKYDAVIMDPPSYGRGASGEVWRMEDDVFALVKLCVQVLSDAPKFFLINSYTTGLQPQTIQNLLTLALGDKRGGTEAYEVCLPTECDIALPCGCSGLWRKQ